MIRYFENRDIFRSKADALVNPVNCKGLMGKGLALEFKNRFPEYFPSYLRACNSGKLVPGRPYYVRLLTQPTDVDTLPGVIMFPTKDHWQDRSQIRWIDEGLAFLRDHYEEWGLSSLAMPQIGCGLGGLNWKDVKPLIEKHLGTEALEVDVYIVDKPPIHAQSR